MTPRWTEEEDATLRRLHALGEAYAEIGRQLGGRTKSQVCGRVWRLGLSNPERSPIVRRSAPKPAPRKAAPAPMEIKSKRGRAPNNRLTPAPHPSKRTPRPSDSIWRPTTCQFPIGDPREPDFHFCGRPITPDGRPYCPEHEARCTIKWVPKRLREAEDEAA